jgi:hypothetical protein
MARAIASHLPANRGNRDGRLSTGPTPRNAGVGAEGQVVQFRPPSQLVEALPGVVKPQCPWAHRLSSGASGSPKRLVGLVLGFCVGEADIFQHVTVKPAQGHTGPAAAAPLAQQCQR